MRERGEVFMQREERRVCAAYLLSSRWLTLAIVGLLPLRQGIINTTATVGSATAFADRKSKQTLLRHHHAVIELI